MLGPMAVIRAARIQTVEDIYGLVWTAVKNRRPIRALYQGHPRLLCPHRLGRNKAGQLRVLCYQYGGESDSGLEPVELLDNDWQTAPNHSRPQTCVAVADIDAED
jgi:hypothetical protein